MNFCKLEKNIVDMIQEEQLKLGYRKETVRLYYPMQSLNRLLETSIDTAQMCEALSEFSRYAESRLGRVEASHRKERFCLTVPAQGSEYVHSHMEDAAFLRDFISAISRHGATMDEVLQQFHRYSDSVQVENPENKSFDYLVFFKDGIPDDFRYCLTDEGGHIIYHRFTPEDYEDFRFDP